MSCLDYNGGYITVYFVQLIRQHISKRGILLNMNYTINNSNLKKLIESLKQGVNKREKNNILKRPNEMVNQPSVLMRLSRGL